jgi:tRNA pseudouridine38-40 synthase
VVARVVRLALAYEGTRYSGFAAQPGRLTVQTTLEGALERLLGHRVVVTPAGRTDAGVHARGQVVSFSTSGDMPGSAVGPALRTLLPEDILAGPSCDVSDDFDARRCALARSYRYSVWNAANPDVIWRRYSLHAPDRLDLDAMNAAASNLVGVHNFSSFIGHAGQESPGASPVREVSAANWRREGDLLHFDCTGNAFARHMIRNVVGTLLWVGRGRLAASDVAAILNSRDRRAAGPTAPPHGLMLTHVSYDREFQT